MLLKMKYLPLPRTPAPCSWDEITQQLGGN